MKGESLALDIFAYMRGETEDNVTHRSGQEMRVDSTGQTPLGGQFPDTPVVVDGSGASLQRSSKPSFHEWKLFLSS
nr:hypothetical protein PHYPA_009315 [Physcomitrium patens]